MRIYKPNEEIPVREYVARKLHDIENEMQRAVFLDQVGDAVKFSKVSFSVVNVGIADAQDQHQLHRVEAQKQGDNGPWELYLTELAVGQDDQDRQKTAQIGDLIGQQGFA